ncbi:MAG: hypothetical protein KatS3mg016_1988 [Fimbriimonadales bacterium]|nr:MAG: hypothetical protein KatS3mg016_1988 [Fimbriimonadales bacterium]
MQQLYDWNGAWLYRNELTETGGLVKVGVRWYDPRWGGSCSKTRGWVRCMLPLTLNAYAYCVNDPVNAVDPSGLWYIKFGVSLDGVAGIWGGTEVGIAVGTDPAGGIRGGPYVSVGGGGGAPIGVSGSIRIGINLGQDLPPPGASDLSGTVGASFGEGITCGIDINIPVRPGPPPNWWEHEYGISLGVGGGLPTPVVIRGGVTKTWYL